MPRWVQKHPLGQPSLPVPDVQSDVILRDSEKLATAHNQWLHQAPELKEFLGTDR